MNHKKINFFRQKLEIQFTKIIRFKLMDDKFTWAVIRVSDLKTLHQIILG